MFRIRRGVLCSFLLEAKIIFYFSLSRRFEKRKRKRRRKRKDNRSRENGEPPRKDAFSICEAEEQTLSCGAKLVRPRGTSKVRSFQLARPTTLHGNFIQTKWIFRCFFESHRFLNYNARSNQSLEKFLTS